MPARCEGRACDHPYVKQNQRTAWCKTAPPAPPVRAIVSEQDRCIAHVRRKFYDLYVAHKSPVAAEALERIEALYAIEKEIRGRLPEE